MPSKPSLFKKEVIKQDFRNIGWIGIVYLLGLLFTLPLQLMMDMNSEFSREMYYDNGLFDPLFLYGIQIIFLFVMPVLMAIFLFRYVHVREAADFIHSLPIKRGSLFNYHIISGTILLIAPILITGSILIISHWIWDVGDYYTLSDLGYWVSVFVIFSLFLFITSVFVGSLTGLSAVQGVLTYVLLVLPAGGYGLISYNLKFFVQGFSIDKAMTQAIENYSPLLEFAMYQPRGPIGTEVSPPIGFVGLVIYFGLALLLYAAALLIYRKRNIENGSQAFAVLTLRPVFKYGTTFSVMLLGGLYFSSSQLSYSWLFIGYAIGAFFGFVISDMLLQKTWRVFHIHKLKGIVSYTAVVVILILAVPIIARGYESAVPPKDDIKNVYMGTSYSEYQGKLELGAPFIHKPDNVEAVRKVHQELIDVAEPMEGGRRTIFLAYELNNGEKVFREYHVKEQRRLPYIEKVYNSKEYKWMTYDAFHVDPSKIDRLTLHSPISQGGPVNIVDPEEITQALQLIKKDILNQSYRNMRGPNGLSISLNIEEGYKHHNVQIPISFTNFKDWLKDKNLYAKMFLQADQVHKVEIIKMKSPMRRGESPYDLLLGESGLETSDNEKIAEVISAASESAGGDYLVGFYISEDELFTVATLEASEAPDWIMDQFK
ncbi:DUF6449 domain-containing protein [Halobacillus naozhouensis]|uniref:DUF6449 domain-containing protein n=1 Tax=Halobacillus naozhouensis TaxID=554880 RepID=A0ABY8IYH2_9BACI|nr:DUF6449 domain-containing protein [Halobacillus naozhouensis]WFT75115.1 DUF6449 domain-containing protein [Halobacillus naozhouensis]